MSFHRHDTIASPPTYRVYNMHGLTVWSSNALGLAILDAERASHNAGSYRIYAHGVLLYTFNDGICIYQAPPADFTEASAVQQAFL